METFRVHESVDEDTWRNLVDGLPSDSDQVLGPPFPCIVWFPDGAVRVEFPGAPNFDGRRDGDAADLERRDRDRIDGVRELLEAGDYRAAHEQVSLFLAEISQEAVAHFWAIVSPEDLLGALA